jgi:hypothetical protein
MKLERKTTTGLSGTHTNQKSNLKSSNTKICIAQARCKEPIFPLNQQDLQLIHEGHRLPSLPQLIEN